MDEFELETLISEREIERRVGELAAEISRDYAGEPELVLVGVLKGAFVFLADLSRKLSIPRRIEFIAVSSYEEGSVASDSVRLVMDLRENIAAKSVLVVEDIVDTGHIVAFNETLSFSITKAGKSWIGSMLSGEGLVCKFEGKGTVWCQSHNAQSFGQSLTPILRPRG